MKRAEKGKRKKSERGGRTGRDVALCQNAALDPVFGDADAQVHSVLAHAHIHARATGACAISNRESLSRTLAPSTIYAHAHARARSRIHTHTYTQTQREREKERGRINHQHVSIGHTIFPRIAYVCTDIHSHSCDPRRARARAFPAL